MEIFIGADPELFLAQEDGSPVSAHGLIPGTKNMPYAVPYGAVQVDGMALEFNIDPAPNYEAFQFNIDTVLAELRRMVPKEYRFAIQPVAEFSQEYMDVQPAVAKELGCEPDFDAYTGEANTRPDCTHNFRTAAGHIHIGWTTGADPFSPEHFASCVDLAKQLDHYIGVPSLFLDRDDRRRELYGRAGCFRPKSYGMEYRTLSNFWLLKPSYTKMVYDNTCQAIRDLMEGKQVVNITWDHYNAAVVINAKYYRDLFYIGEQLELLNIPYLKE